MSFVEKNQRLQDQMRLLISLSYLCVGNCMSDVHVHKSYVEMSTNIYYTLSLLSF